jgi:hypothetical protein
MATKKIDSNNRIYLNEIELEALEAGPGDIVNVRIELLKKAEKG